MPQLMPLFWLISNFFIILFLFIVIMIYNNSLIFSFKVGMKNSSSMFCWCW